MSLNFSTIYIQDTENSSGNSSSLGFEFEPTCSEIYIDFNQLSNDTYECQLPDIKTSNEDSIVKVSVTNGLTSGMTFIEKDLKIVIDQTQLKIIDVKEHILKI